MYGEEKPHTRKKNTAQKKWVNRERYLLRPDEHAEIKIN
jgi:hypothetical protein